jgi:hypothetical protein
VGFDPALNFYFAERVMETLLGEISAPAAATIGSQDYQDSEELLLLESLFSVLLASSFLPLASLELSLG